MIPIKDKYNIDILCLHIFVYILSSRYIDMYVYIYIYIYICMYIGIYMYVYACGSEHIYTSVIGYREHMLVGWIWH